MNQTLMLAAWLDANAKHMKYEQESVQMRKAAKELRLLDQEVKECLDSLKEAYEMLSDIRKALEKANDDKLSQQEATGNSERVSVPMLWR